MNTTGTEGGDGSGRRSSRDVTLTAAGLTLLGVLLSVGVTVGMGLEGEWWVRVLAGAASTAGLILVVAWTTSRGRGPVAKLANWLIGVR